jgi:FdhE protein
MGSFASWTSARWSASASTSAVMGSESGAGSSGAGAGAPLLQGRTIAIDLERATRLVRRLATLAVAEGSGGLRGGVALAGYRPSGSEILELLRRAMRQEASGTADPAAGGIDAGAVRAIGELAVRPLLRACAAVLEEHVPAQWRHGYCPICAAWPVLVEQRGLDRARWARCGRCGGQWRADWLRCVFCGEREHERLGSLVPEDGGEVLKLETCSTCHGYVKTVTTLQAQSPLELLLRDVETLELDLIALDRGYERPAPMFRLDVRLVEHST